MFSHSDLNSKCRNKNIHFRYHLKNIYNNAKVYSLFLCEIRTAKKYTMYNIEHISKYKFILSKLLLDHGTSLHGNQIYQQTRILINYIVSSMAALSFIIVNFLKINLT